MFVKSWFAVVPKFPHLRNRSIMFKILIFLKIIGSYAKLVFS
ncbi:hypothetical protein LBBP_00472 [Leptospira borgpetersenii serovar Ballum]|uniref:Uncharacterized protein n=1 Tax=Leptospira borgpetersenii serovar Ballum TaxID=280505 RepID=A0A0S2IMF9_LEPBO|nr:hypothetical protein LBBP_00472 [Leptospira borgpetersenii serovar Ballum]